MSKYDDLVKRHRQDHVHKTRPELKLVNPFTHSELKDVWDKKFSGRLEALNETSKLDSKKLLVFLDYWHLKQLKIDLEKEKKGQISKTPWERAMKKLTQETWVGDWLWHNFVCFIKDTPAASDPVSKGALSHCLCYFLGLIEAQETKVMAVTNWDVLQTLLRHYPGLRRPKSWKDAIFNRSPIILPNRFETKVIALPHPGSRGQQYFHEKYSEQFKTELKREPLLVKWWHERLVELESEQG